MGAVPEKQSVLLQTPVGCLIVGQSIPHALCKMFVALRCVRCASFDGCIYLNNSHYDARYVQHKALCKSTSTHRLQAGHVVPTSL